MTSMQPQVFMPFQKAKITNWGEPERAPHKREVRAVGLSVCPYVHDTKIYKNSINLRVPSVVDCSWFVHQHSTNM